MLNLALAAGGVTESEILAAGMVEPKFLGYPVEFCQIMPATFAVSQVCCYFGSLPLAASFGDRRQVTLAVSEHLNFDSDQIALRGTERFDIVIHDVGNFSATASLRVPGPIVGLITGAS
jgi:HK97 family phage major capsid protein